jgi:hypothetical protein
MLFKPENIEKTLTGLEETWFPDELATLYCNSRTEMNIRDKFNIHFAKKLKGNDAYFIQREWRKTDLAIIEYKHEKTEPVALFEFKARHTFFVANNERGRNNGLSGYEKTFYGDGFKKNGIKQDIEKLKPFADKIPCYSVLIGVHPIERIPGRFNVFEGDCKEIKAINESFERFGDEARIKELCNLNAKSFCEANNHSFIELEYNIGKALGIDWKMMVWVMFKKY